jgi:hypothetical protein
MGVTYSAGNQVKIAGQTDGDTMYFDGTTSPPAWTLLNKGTAGNLLVQGTSHPEWMANGSEGEILEISGGVPTWVSAPGVAAYLIGTQRLASAAANITFGSIPSGFKQFQLIGHLQTATFGQQIQLQFNTSTGGYTVSYWYPSGFNSSTGQSAIPLSVNSTIMGAFNATITNSTSDYKYVAAQSGNNPYPGLTNGFWLNNDEINTIILSATGGNLAAGSYVSLLGYK